MRKPRRYCVEDDGSPSLWRLNQQRTASSQRTSHASLSGYLDDDALSYPPLTDVTISRSQEVKMEEEEDSESDLKPAAQVSVISEDAAGVIASNVARATALRPTSNLSHLGDFDESASSESESPPFDEVGICTRAAGIRTVAASRYGFERSQTGAFAVAGPDRGSQESVDSWQDGYSYAEEDKEEEKSRPESESTESSPRPVIEAHVVDVNDDPSLPPDVTRRLEQLDNAVDAEIVPEKKWFSSTKSKLVCLLIVALVCVAAVSTTLAVLFSQNGITNSATDPETTVGSPAESPTSRPSEIIITPTPTSAPTIPLPSGSSSEPTQTALPSTTTNTPGPTQRPTPRPSPAATPEPAPTPPPAPPPISPPPERPPPPPAPQPLPNPTPPPTPPPTPKPSVAPVLPPPEPSPPPSTLPPTPEPSPPPSIPAPTAVCPPLDSIRDGTIPTEIGLCTDLEVLNLSWRQLTGPIPKELGLLTNLVELYLWKNGLSGSIPEKIGLLTKLETLNLEGNNLLGSIPDQIGLLTNLVQMTLGSNGRLTGSIPGEIGFLTNIIIVDLSRTGLTGTLPKEIALLNEMTIFYLRETSVSGNLPEEIGLMTKLVTLSLSENNFSGTIPNQILLLTKLAELHLFGNNFTGSFVCPESIYQCWISCRSASGDPACRSQ